MIAMAEVNPKESARGLQREFQKASAPELSAQIGTHEAEFAGWLRLAGPLTMRLTGMPGWWGKRFRAPTGGGESLEGENLLLRGGGVWWSRSRCGRRSPLHASTAGPRS